MKPEDKEAFEAACNDWATKSEGKDLGEYLWQAACAHRDAQPAVAVNDAMLNALDNLVSACELPGDHCEMQQALPHAIAAIEAAKMAKEQ